ncbi:MAG TPA: hypothetical protein VN554_02700 [Verrucomicrobiae bacterium]|nr:hypothetical protein [Verrucomicrobiae bacterium]
MSKQTGDKLTVVSGLVDPSLALDTLGEFGTLFRRPRPLEQAVGQKGILASAASLEGTAVGEVVDLVNTEVAEHGHSVGTALDGHPVQTFELSDASTPFRQRLTEQVDGLVFAALSGRVAIQVGESGADLLPGDVAFIEGDGAGTVHSISALPGSFATGLLIGTTAGVTERVPELAQAA